VTEAILIDSPRSRTRAPKTRSTRTRRGKKSARRTRRARTRSPSHGQRTDGVRRRADSCNSASDYMRHRVRRS
jgi:hypothetical protein